jgi:uncharacterized protein
MESIECLIVFTRYPIPGKTKTRLIPALGAAGAANLHCQMTEHTLAQVRQLQADGVAIEVHYAGAEFDRDLADWLGADLVYRSQGDGDLGDRMALAIKTAVDAGYERVIIIGTDCPGLSADILQLAFQQLRDRDVVLGPAIDGGYYLIGMQRFIPELFVGIDWGTSAVRQQTIEIATKLGLSMGDLPLLADIDRPEDLPIWAQIISRARSIVVE